MTNSTNATNKIPKTTAKIKAHTAVAWAFTVFIASKVVLVLTKVAWVLTNGSEKNKYSIFSFQILAGHWQVGRHLKLP